MTYIESLNVKAFLLDKITGLPQKISRKGMVLDTDTISVLDLGCGHRFGWHYAFAI